MNSSNHQNLSRFRWHGTDHSGKKVNGEATATNPGSLQRELYTQGILAYRIRRQTDTGTTNRKSLLGRRMPTLLITVFLRQCANLLNAGIPLVQAIDICLDSSPHPVFTQQLQQVRDELAAGSSFHNALRGSRLGYDKLLVNLIQAAEQSGTLDRTMTRLARDHEKSAQLRARVRKALMYPLAVLVVALLVSAILLTRVVPEFARTFSELGAELPDLTRIVLELSAFAQSYALHLLLLSVAASAAILLALQRLPQAQTWRDRILLRLPVVGTIIQHACLTRFCQTIASSLAAGLPLLQALQSTAAATGNRIYETACLEMAEHINQGRTLSFAVRKSAWFPVMIVQLIQAGEQSGTLDQMLEHCACRYEQSVDNAVDSLGSLIEPVIMTVLGAIIATLMLAMYLPVFRLGAVL